MAKDDTIRVEGRITEMLPNAKFRCEITNLSIPSGSTIICHLSGKMRKNNIRVLLHDRVDVEMSVYDMTKGRIVYRHK